MAGNSVSFGDLAGHGAHEKGMPKARMSGAMSFGYLLRMIRQPKGKRKGQKPSADMPMMSGSGHSAH